MRQYGRALEYASEELCGDFDVVLAAVMQDGASLEFASKVFWADREIVLAAVSNDGWSLDFASSCLHNDRELVLTAVLQQPNALHLTHLRDDFEFLSEVASKLGVEDDWTDCASARIKNLPNFPDCLCAGHYIKG